MKRKKLALGMILAGSVSTGFADVCKIEPGSVTCGKGTVSELSGNGMVTVSGTTVTGDTNVNGLLRADDANFGSLQVNGSASLTECTINNTADIKGTLNASSTKFENILDVYSSLSRFINSKMNNNLHIHHNDAKKQLVYLDNNTEVNGDIIFDDGNGEVVVRGGSKIAGKVIGGQAIYK